MSKEFNSLEDLIICDINNKTHIPHESDSYRWKSSFDFKKNINKMYYTNLSDGYVLQNYLRHGYNQVGQVVEFLDNRKYDRDDKQQMDEQKPYALMKKYQNLFTLQTFLQREATSKNNYEFSPKQFNNIKVREYFSNLKQNHKQFSSNKTQKQYFVFQEIMKTISSTMNYNVYLPTMVKVIMANVNWIDRENDTASIALKIEVKVNVPGISQYPYFYEEVFKEKMKISLKTSNRSNVFNQKIIFQKQKNEQTCEIVDGKNFKKKTLGKYYHDPIQFLDKVYKWSNYDKPTYIYHKRAQQFEGFILEAQVNDVRVLIDAKTFMSPFEMIDLHGIVELDQIITEMKDWEQILYKKDKSSLKQFLIEASPKVTIKFNLISLYQNVQDVSMNEKICQNQIRSFDAVEKDGYKLAQNLMFLEVTNKRQSRYQLKKYSKCRGSYSWQRQNEQKLKNTSQITKNKQGQKQKQKQTIQQPMTTERRSINHLQKNQSLSFEDLKQFNRTINQQFLQLRESIHKQSDKKKYEFQQRIQSLYQNPENSDYQQVKYEFYHQPENLKQNNFQKQVEKLQYIEQQYIDFEQKMNESLKDISKKNKGNTEHLNNQIYKFAKYKYQFQKYYKRILEILIVQKDKKIDQSQNIEKNQGNFIKKLKDVIDNNHYSDHKNLRNVKTDQQYHFPKAIYHFSFYRNPLPTLLLLFSSTIILCVINLFIFFQQQDLNGRLATIATLMICFIGLVGIMQKQIHSETISCFEILIYATMLTPVLCLVFSLQSYLNERKITYEYVMGSPLFWVSCLISLFGLLIPVVFSVLFLCCESQKYEKDYNADKNMQPLFLLFPGSPEIDQLVEQQQKSLQLCDGSTQSNQFQQQQPWKKKTLQRVVTSLMAKHLNSLYELRKTDFYIKIVQKYIIEKLQQSIKNNKQFIENTLEIDLESTTAQINKHVILYANQQKEKQKLNDMQTQKTQT